MFRVGDEITGAPNSDQHYSITTDRALMRVLSVNSPEVMSVEVLDHAVYESEVGVTFIVNPKYFVFASKVAEEEKRQENFLKSLLQFTVDSLDYKVTITEKHLEIGCQKITKEDAIFLAKRVLWAYE